MLPGPQKYVEEWPFGLYVGVLGHYFTYFWVLGVRGEGSGVRT